jgi:mRNA-degrading endonuclease toxin of MazEF toxin-antitoxin module
VPKRAAGLTKESLIDCGRSTTVAIEQLGRGLGTLSAELLLDLNTALKRSLALP